MKKELQRKIALSLGLALCVALSATAQEANEFQAENTQSSWYLGIGGGYRFNKMSYSDLDKDDFPSNKMTGSGIFSIFVNGEFGKNRQFGIRPQVTFLNRGGKLSGIFGEDNAYEENQINNIFTRSKPTTSTCACLSSSTLARLMPKYAHTYLLHQYSVCALAATSSYRQTWKTTNMPAMTWTSPKPISTRLILQDKRASV